MAMHLYDHNQIAYNAAVRMLEERGKAAVIHPTGTGKSFIGFKLCEDNPEKTICWLSPSRYIYQTQLENLREVSEDYSPENVKFFTYAKLMLMSEEEISEIQPDYIILDEYHRVGAEQWGQGVENVLRMYPDVPVLGLSATAIRYLDNQRNMTEELLDGNIASEMTLGEAIVRNILAPPKYILSIFSYQKDLEKYEKRVATAKSKAVQDAADKYLDALRRALDKAEKLDVLFDKHMTDRTGKYIVFCANLEHMQDMMDKAREWFRNVDKKPHIYSVYSDDPSASKSFADFKTDNDNKHLKLLYCIDALNEGVHVPDISGVILLRPTISPIIYKQQIGRALSASKSHEPVIFDIVNNIENLYSIDAIQEEMQVAIEYYRSHGGENFIVNETFELIDKVADCKSLFDELEGTLSASWDLMYEKAKEYYELNGNLNIPKRYFSPEGYSLGLWLQTQRRVYNGNVNGILTQVQIDRLNSIGMRWESHSDVNWNKYYESAVRYHEKNGDLKVPTTYVDEYGIDLGRWLAQLRAYRKSGIRSNYMTPDRIKQLEDIGIIWDVIDYLWEANYAAALRYHQKYGDLNVPYDYVDDQGVRLGVWINNLRVGRRRTDKPAGKLTDDQLDRLNALGIIWETKAEKQWNDAFDELCKYHSINGSFEMPTNFKTESGFDLWKWVRRQREYFKKGTLKEEYTQRLSSIGLTFDLSDPWEKKYQLAKTYFEEHGNLEMPGNYVVEGVWLNKWLNEQKHIAQGERKKVLSPEQLERLLAIGLKVNTSSKDVAWERHYNDLVDYYRKNGNIEIPNHYKVEGFDLSIWLRRQKDNYRKGILKKEYILKLEKLPIEWDTVVDKSYDIGFAHLADFLMTNTPNTIVSSSVCKDGYKLGSWISNCKMKYNKGKLDEKYIRRFAEYGISLEPKQSRWNEYLEEVREYFILHNTRRIPKGYRGESGIDLNGWISDQRRYYRKGKLSDEQGKALDELGVINQRDKEVRNIALFVDQ